MLPKKRRLDRKTIEKVFSSGRFIKSGGLSLKFIVAPGELKFPRASFVVPKSVSSSAVERNRLRRNGYKAIDKNLTNFPGGFTGVFIFNKKNLDINNEIENIICKMY